MGLYGLIHDRIISDRYDIKILDFCKNIGWADEIWHEYYDYKMSSMWEYLLTEI